jgi:hypothetical protein
MVSLRSGAIRIHAWSIDQWSDPGLEEAMALLISMILSACVWCRSPPDYGGGILVPVLVLAITSTISSTSTNTSEPTPHDFESKFLTGCILNILVVIEPSGFGSLFNHLCLPETGFRTRSPNNNKQTARVCRFGSWPTAGFCLTRGLDNFSEISGKRETFQKWVHTVDGGNLAPPKYVKTLNWSETGQIASDVDKNLSRLRYFSRRFRIWHSRRNLRNVA